MIARNFDVTLDPAARPVTELLGFTMSPRSLRLRLRERTPGRHGAGLTRLKT